MSEKQQSRVLTIAGSDSSGGAGIQADVKTITVLGGYAATAITALTAQNTEGVKEIYPVSPDFVTSQITAVLEDIGADVIKIGMLANQEIIQAVAETMKSYPEIPIVLDPVMVAKGGHSLLDEGAVAALKKHLIPGSSLLTPNIPEAEALSGRTIRTIEDMKKAGQDLMALGASAVLVKGGHLEGDDLSDVLVMADGVEVFTSKRIKTRHTHGTGCTLSSGIAVFLASGAELKKAVGMARDYVLSAMVSAPEFGQGHGPLGHNFGRNLTD